MSLSETGVLSSAGKSKDAVAQAALGLFRLSRRQVVGVCTWVVSRWRCSLRPGLWLRGAALPRGPHATPCRAPRQQGSLQVLPGSALTRETFLVGEDCQSGASRLRHRLPPQQRLCPLPGPAPRPLGPHLRDTVRSTLPSPTAGPSLHRVKLGQGQAGTRCPCWMSRRV